MRIVRKVLLLTVVGLVAAAVLAMTAAPTQGGVHPKAVPPVSSSWVQPPAWIPIAAELPGMPPVVGAAHLWVQPPAWIPITA